MANMDQMINKVKWMPQGLIRFLEKWLRKLPSVKKEIESQTVSMVDDLKSMVKPYTGKFQSYSKLPESGIDRNEILNELKKITSLEEKRWKEGLVSGAVYHGDSEHIKFLNEVYALQSQSNPLHSDLFPSASKFESEIVSMTAQMLSADKTNDEVCGVVTSGGTESILLAMKTYRDRAKEVNGIRRPNIVIPVTAHAAFDKAGEYFKIKVKRVPVDKNFQADINAVRKAANGNTICIVGSAPNFPQGTIDPIGEMSEIARERGICFHVDACLGGFVLPWAEKLGYPVPEFDFRLPGVTSISADTHKFGYAAKGTSVILYRTPELRRYQYYTISDWPGGLYFSPTFAGSRPGALSATCWATMLSLGEDGYRDSVKKILEAAEIIKRGISEISGLKLMGDPLWVIAFKSNEIDIYKVMDQMTHKGWNLNGLHKPACVHICITLRHTQVGVAHRFLSDLKDSVDYVKENPSETGGMAPVYGMAASLPFRGVIRDFLKRYLDMYYKV
ncbi:MAG: aminotransferase class V-fold PLP-dependent enzyme [Candidatus Marinimicrobia bacterium]|nr:aminotransferase class V-fold PLP-dependent enzyme [Candidatus Neomarinimicrobiota bacterium]